MVRLKPDAGFVAASFRVSTMSALLGIGSLDVWLNTNSSSTCTFSPDRVLAKALKGITCLQITSVSVEDMRFKGLCTLSPKCSYPFFHARKP